MNTEKPTVLVTEFDFDVYTESLNFKTRKEAVEAAYRKGMEDANKLRDFEDGWEFRFLRILWRKHEKARLNR